MQATPHNTCATLLDDLRSSGLTYKLNETPYSVYLTIRKKFIKDHTATHSGVEYSKPEMTLKNLEMKIDNLKEDLENKCRVNEVEKESLNEKLKDANLEIATSRMLIRELHKNVSQYETKLADLAYVEKELENAINWKNRISVIKEPVDTKSVVTKRSILSIGKNYLSCSSSGISTLSLCQSSTPTDTSWLESQGGSNNKTTPEKKIYNVDENDNNLVTVEPCSFSDTSSKTSSSSFQPENASCIELGGKFRICRNYPDIIHPKPVSESFLAKTKFRLTMNGQIT